MNKKYAKLFDAIKLFRAPLRLLPYVMSLLIQLVNRYLADEEIERAEILEQGFSARRINSALRACRFPSFIERDGISSLVFCADATQFGDSAAICLRSDKNPRTLQTAGLRFIDTSGIKYTKAIAFAFGEKNLLFTEHSGDSCSKGCIFDKGFDSRQEMQPLDFSISNGFVSISENECLVCGVCEGEAVAALSFDSAKSFSAVSKMNTPIGLTADSVSIVRLTSGRVLAAQCCDNDLHINYSDDIGKSWSVAKALGVSGSEPQLILLSDGRVLLTYISATASHGAKCIVGTADGEFDCKEYIVFTSSDSQCSSPRTAVTAEGTQITFTSGCFCESVPSIQYAEWHLPGEKPPENEKKRRTKN